MPSTTASGSSADGRVAGRLKPAAADLLHAFGFDRRRRGMKQDRKLVDGEQRTASVLALADRTKVCRAVERERRKRGRELIQLTACGRIVAAAAALR